MHSTCISKNRDLQQVNLQSLFIEPIQWNAFLTMLGTSDKIIVGGFSASPSISFRTSSGENGFSSERKKSGSEMESGPHGLSS